MVKKSCVIVSIFSALAILGPFSQSAIGGDDQDWVRNGNILSPLNATTDRVSIGGNSPLAPDARLSVWGQGAIDQLTVGRDAIFLNPPIPLHVRGSRGVRLSDPAGDANSFMTILPNADVRDLNPGLSTVASQITNRNLGHLVLDVKANDLGDSFAIRTDTNRNGEVDKIAVVVKPTGNVGIATTNPSVELDVGGNTRTEVLEITGGSDLAEPFEIVGEGDVEPGMVVSIDPDSAGRLRISDRAYDRTVAGIVSGANGLRPGLTMTKANSALDGLHPVALTGRVYALADISGGAIQPGDLLTTSDVPGHAMKVSDHEKAQGAIIGKAMTGLEHEHGMVLVLVNLQ